MRRPTITLDSDAAYALWAASYPPAPHNPLMRAEQTVMETILASLQPTRALDVGTGTGRYLQVLARRGVARPVGLDCSWPMLARAARDSPLVCADATALPFAAASFDLVVASLMVGDVADLDRWARETSRVLRPGGRLIYSDFHDTWTRAGWQRTFTLPDGTRVIVRRQAHTLQDHHDALTRAGLDLVEVRDVHLGGDPDRALRALRRRESDEPVALVIHGRKP